LGRNIIRKKRIHKLMYLIYFILVQPEVEFGKLPMEEKLIKIFQMAILVGVLVL